MKKVKTFFAGLCVSALLFSATPSIISAAAPGGPDGTSGIELRMSQIYGEKAGKIADYLEKERYAADIVEYGSYTANLYTGTWDDKKSLFVSIGQINLVLADNKDNGYGSVDVVYKEDCIESWKRSKINVTPEEEKKLNKLYRKIIDQFYSENEDMMKVFEKKAEQNKEMEEISGIVYKK